MPDVKLAVPYRSQLDNVDADYSFNDCGPACIAMMASAAGHNVTVNDVYKNNNYWDKGLIAVGTIKSFGDYYGLNLKRHSDALKTSGVEAARRWIDEGRPALILMEYRLIRDNGLSHPSQRFGGGHFVVITGYGEGVIYIHDPLWPKQEGAYRAWPLNIFEQVWAGAAGDQYDRTALVPVSAIAALAAPPYPLPDDVQRRMRARTAYDGWQQPRITSDADYQAALSSLGNFAATSAVYKVAAGDTLDAIAQKQMGSGEFFAVLAAYNGITTANPHRIGQEIRIPALPQPPVRPTRFTNQQVINAFSEVYKERGAASGAFFQAMERAGIGGIAGTRQAPYTSTPIADLPNLDIATRNAVLAKLGAASGGVSSELRTMPAAYSFTNQDVINAFVAVYGERNQPPEAAWQAVVAAGLEDIAKARGAAYNGPAIATLPNLDTSTRSAISTRLGQALARSASQAGLPPVRPDVTPPAGRTITNQEVINAFYHVHKQANAAANDYWLALMNA
ncbi:MAG: C39 family peptidase, partial [Anaerolineae bacterium]|nr:C39 family peptidase [Anaerolineae bacterium]